MSVNTNQLWSGGPAHVYCGLGSNGSPLYFGTSEGAPRWENRKFFEDVHNDWAGSMQPFDKGYQGQVAIVSGNFTRWNNQMFQQMMSCPNPFAIPGLNRGGDLATFMIQEGAAYPIWLQSPYAFAKSAMLGLESGLHYFAAFMVGPDSKVIGTRTMKARCTWFCMPVFSPDTNNTVQQILYDFNCQNLPAIS